MNASNTQARQMTAEDLLPGHVPCDCGEFTYVFSTLAMQRLPRDYQGEECPRCHLWMCRISKLEESAQIDDD